MLVSQIHPVLYKASVATHRARRSLNWMWRRDLAKVKSETKFPHNVYSHQSILLRTLGDVDMRLQHNKVTNLKLAAARVSDVIIRPGETFSLWKLVGLPTAKKGYLEGMVLSNGEASSDIGGGLCQLANLIYWMVLHSPLTVTERHRHSFDPFPDSGRVLPFGTGATIFYNYYDLQFRNDTETAFQLRVWVTDRHLRGELLSYKPIEFGYHVFDIDHHFVTDARDGQTYRCNKILRDVYRRSTGQTVGREFLYENHCRVKYALPIGAKVERMGAGPASWVTQAVA